MSDNAANEFVDYPGADGDHHATAQEPTNSDNNVNQGATEVLGALMGLLRSVSTVSNPRTSDSTGGSGEYHVSWTQLPKLDTSQSDEIDNWFIAFEHRMEAAHVKEDNWASRFLECPMVEEAIKTKVRTCLSYKALRAELLAEYGPVDPVNYYRSEISEVRGRTREEVWAKLQKLQTNYNRAADDEHRERIRDNDLCYPFVKAFPSEIRSQLLQHLPLVISDKMAVKQLIRLAPSKSQQKVDLNVLQEKPRTTEKPRAEKRSRERSFGTEELKSIMGMMMQQWQPAKRWKPERPSNPNFVPQNSYQTVVRTNRGVAPFQPFQCRKCGRSRCNLVDCPARNSRCNKCQKMGHFQKVCLSSFRKEQTSEPPS